jgi:hypothetical protein
VTVGSFQEEGRRTSLCFTSRWEARTCAGSLPPAAGGPAEGGFAVMYSCTRLD